MSDQTDATAPQQLLERARQAEADGADQAARDLYDRIIASNPYSKAARVAGERLLALRDDGGEESTAAPVADRAMQAAEENRDITCPHCGGTDFEAGELQASNRETYFRSDADDSVMNTLFSTGDDVDAYVCTRCGNLELFATLSG